MSRRNKRSHRNDKKNASITISKGKWSTYTRPCSHHLDPLLLSDGETTIFASAYFDTPHFLEIGQIPDVGVYLDSSWRPNTFAYAIGWPDYQLPNLCDSDLLRVARAVIDHAYEGEVVEVGCLGAHGRTGTFLAILDLMVSSFPDADHSIAHVRKEHCSKAIESEEQEWYVAKIAAILNGEETPAKPSRGKQRPYSWNDDKLDYIFN